MTTATATKAPKILDAINAIQAEVGSIPKNGVMKFGATNYNFIQNDDILAKVSALLQENNVVTKPRILQRIYESRDLGANRTLPIISVELSVTYISAVDGSEFETVVWGEGAGNDDKGLRKAVTTAQKIANLLTFNIATGEPDPDDYPSAPTTPATPTATRVDNTIANAGNDKTAQIKKLRAQVKAAAGAIGYGSAEINKVGEVYGKDYVNDPEALQKVYDDLIAVAQVKQEA